MNKKIEEKMRKLLTALANGTLELQNPPDDWADSEQKAIDASVEQALTELSLLMEEARKDELIRLKQAHSINIFDEYIENRLKALRESK